jgi:hypothetical protein
VLSHFFDCYSVQSFHMIRCSAIPRAIVLSHSSELNHFSLLQCATIHRAIVLSHFSMQKSAQSFFNATILSHFFYCYSARSFIIIVVREADKSFCKMTEFSRGCTRAGGELVAQSQSRAGGELVDRAAYAGARDRVTHARGVWFGRWSR